MTSKIKNESTIIVNQIQWDASTTTWQRLFDEFNMSFKDWSPGEIGTNSFYLKTAEGKFKVKKGDFVMIDENCKLHYRKNI